MATATAAPDRRSGAELTTQLLGRPMTMHAALEHLMDEEFQPSTSDLKEGAPGSTWLGSVGYEHYKENGEFARRVKSAGVECLIDVRELPISRRRGYAKTALGEAMAAVGVEYLHMRGLGNPKPIRDLYKSGRVEEGEAKYRKYLLTEQRTCLEDLVGHLTQKRCALMCLEGDPQTCHRTVIIESLRQELDLEFELAHID